MPGAARIIEIVQALAEAIERGDEGDMDSPSWENDDRLLRLSIELKLMARSVVLEPREPAGPAPIPTEDRGFGDLPAA